MTDNHLNTNKLLKDCVVYDWGKIQYKEAWDKQTILANELIAAKKQSDFPVNEHPYKLIFCEHNPVYTLGKSIFTSRRWAATVREAEFLQ